MIDALKVNHLGVLLKWYSKNTSNVAPYRILKSLTSSTSVTKILVSFGDQPRRQIKKPGAATKFSWLWTLYLEAFRNKSDIFVAHSIVHFQYSNSSETLEMNYTSNWYLIIQALVLYRIYCLVVIRFLGENGSCRKVRLADVMDRLSISWRRTAHEQNGLQKLSIECWIGHEILS